MTTLWVSAGIRLLPGKSLTDAVQALSRLQQATQHEPGCRQFEIHQHLDQEGYFTLWECWKDQAALEAHLSAEHTKDYFSHGYTELRSIEKMKRIGFE